MYDFIFLTVTFLYLVFVLIYSKFKTQSDNSNGLELIISLIIFAYSLPVAVASLYGIDHFQIGAERIVLIYSSYIFCAISILLGYYLNFVSYKYSVTRLNLTSNDSYFSKRSVFFVLLIGVFLYFSFLISSYDSIAQMIQETSREERFSNAKGKGVLTSGLYLINFAWIYIFYTDLKRPSKKRFALHLIFLGFYIAFFSALGDRRVWVSLLIGLVFVWSLFNKFHLIRSLIYGGIALIILQIFSKVRGYSYSLTEMIEFVEANFSFEWFDLSSGEFGWHYLIVSDIIDYVSTHGISYGITYLEAPLASIPSFLWEDKPTGLSPWYASIYFPDYYFAGGTLAFSVVAEAFLNFHFLGLFIVPFIYGYLVSSLLRFLQRKLTVEIYYTCCASMLSIILIFARSDLAALINQLIIAVIMPFFVYSVVNFILKIKFIRF